MVRSTSSSLKAAISIDSSIKPTPCTDSQKYIQLFVGGMHSGSNIEQVKEALGGIGSYKNFTLIMDNRVVHRGYAFVDVPFDNVSAFLGKVISLGDTCLFINRARKKLGDTSMSNRIYFMKDFF